MKISISVGDDKFELETDGDVTAEITTLVQTFLLAADTVPGTDGPSLDTVVEHVVGRRSKRADQS